MELVEISKDEYYNLEKENCIIFCKVSFLELNIDKVEKIRYLLGKDKKNRLLIAFGEKEGEWGAPFSAPFSTIIEIQKNTSIELYWEFVDAFTKYAKICNISKINIVLPPDIYNQTQNSKLINALLGNGYIIDYGELNYSINLEKIQLENYMNSLQNNARKNLKIALKSGLEIFECDTLEKKYDAYKVIQMNRESKGYPLRMSFEQVKKTIEILQHNIFLVMKDQRAIAAAIVFWIDDENVQVIYWGDIPLVGEYKPINFLAYELIKYYKYRGVKNIDIGPSTERGIPNYGLCNFKEGIGCEISKKFCLKRNL